MLVDPQPPPPLFPSSFEDFFNMDLVSSSSSSSSSPHSPPAASFPLTPPQQAPMHSFMSYDGPGIGGDPSDFLNMYLDEDYSKPPYMMGASSSAPYDFLGTFDTLASSSSTSDSQSSSPNPFATTTTDSPLFSIDPALVGTPGNGNGSPEQDHEFDGSEHDEEVGPADEDDDDEEEDRVVPTITIAPVKVGGKGKARKGTVASGGIKKSSVSLSVSSSSSPTSPSSAAPQTASGEGHREPGGKVEDRESEDWRPSPEEYKKMSSKEKRQLRNKISARNFRVRRKEYISTLEADISERDALISAIRSELGSSQSENVALRQEISALKRTLLTGRSGTGAEASPVLPPPAPLSPPRSPVSSPTPAPTAATSAALFLPNTQKDLPTSPRSAVSAARGFWGGAGAMAGGFTPVHTTFVPPLSMTGVSGAVLARKAPSQQQENINPALNRPPPPPRMPSPPITNPSPFANAAKSVNLNMNVGQVGGFDAFADMNPFTLKTLDAYRMQLWGKMAAQQREYQAFQQAQAQLQQQQQQGQGALSGLAQSLRPQFFKESTGLSGSLASSLSGKPASPFIPGSLLGRGEREKEREKEKEVQRDAMFAAIASQTLLGKLGSAFWDAFAGSGSASVSPFSSTSAAAAGSPSVASAGGAKQWDADKVRRVLEGKAVVRVVDVEGPTVGVKVVPRIVGASPVASPSAPTATTSPAPPSPAPAIGCSRRKKMGVRRERENCVCVADILEESMRSLSLGKK